MVNDQAVGTAPQRSPQALKTDSDMSVPGYEVTRVRELFFAVLTPATARVTTHDPRAVELEGQF
jgi:hypothetical protein